jgi:predicted enzyme related to lactoylglutathione lyase
VSGAWVTGRASARELALLAYIWVDSIQDTVNLVAANGGVIIDAPHPDSPGGSCWIATFHDPGGNMIGLYQET